MALWLQSRGHSHAPNEPCPEQDKKSGICHFFPYNVSNGIRKFEMITHGCPISKMVDDIHYVRYGQMHATDHRMLDLSSSADHVVMVLAVSEFYQTGRLAKAMATVMASMREG